MTKQEFLARLEQGLSGIPRADLDERLGFYGEMIDDRTEDGCSEDEAGRWTRSPWQSWCGSA